jgi:hypothetical protein
MLEFRIMALQQETEALAKLAEDFLDTSRGDALAVLATNLKLLLYTENPQAQRLQIPDIDGERVRTTVGRGYEPGRRAGGYNVAGELSFTWTVQPIVANAARDRKFKLIGNASTKLRILEVRVGQPDKLLAQWQVEIGTQTSPGCLFHVAVNHTDPPPALFRSSLPVPRLPSMLITPTDALDFLLGELFQTSWRQRNGEERDDASVWGKLQKRRLKSALRWHHDELDAATGSAWNWLKNRRQPPPELFL